MARRKTPPDSVRAKCSLSDRLRSLRAELFGERGGPELARRLGIPVRTWYNYEAGVTVPSEVVLRFIELTSVDPMWLLHGRGSMFRTSTLERNVTTTGPEVLVHTLLRTAIQILEQGETPASSDRDPSRFSDEEGTASEVLPIGVYDAEGQANDSRTGLREIVAYSGERFDSQLDCRCIRVAGDAMSPIVADGAYVAFAKDEEEAVDLDGKMVIAWVDDQPIVRWFQHCGRYALLRAENPAALPAQVLVDLEVRPEERRFRRVLWINTPH